VKIGPQYNRDGKCEFVVWAPFLEKLELEIIAPTERSVPLEKDPSGYWRGVAPSVLEGTLYRYRLAWDKVRPDPASHYQPHGVHEASQVINHASFGWEDKYWKGIELSRMIMYELHVGTFTPEGTFDAIIPRLGELKELGVNAIELMPVAQFPGERNWGYDGVYPFAVQASYGGPAGLKRLANECHKHGIAVILDVVYNHLGPEGNYLSEFGPYFTDRYRTPWGRAVNLDGPCSDDVRNFFIENSFHWFENYHIDALRLDAVHAIFDMSAHPFLEELAERVDLLSKSVGRKFYLIAESSLNDSKLIRPREQGGYGLDAQWIDDFHHSVHTLLTGEKVGYYVDFGKIDHLVKSLREGYVLSGEYSAYRKRRHGNSSKDRPASQFVVCTKNHDQIGNRMLSERMSSLVSFEALKLDAAVTILSPFIPLFFMGEEYAEDAPFLYFVSHSDPDLIEAVRKGRKEEFESFDWQGEPPDPQSSETFEESRIHWEKRTEGRHRVMLDFYKRLIRARVEIPALSNLDKNSLDVSGAEDSRVVTLRRWHGNSNVCLFFNFNKEDAKHTSSLPEGKWKKILDSSDEEWDGPGSLLPDSFVTGEEIVLRQHSASLFSAI
jgi:maltooligosyltrehalose trehalohydrolase